jgi:hypothetical protein
MVSISKRKSFTKPPLVLFLNLSHIFCHYVMVCAVNDNRGTIILREKIQSSLCVKPYFYTIQ